MSDTSLAEVAQEPAPEVKTSGETTQNSEVETRDEENTNSSESVENDSGDENSEDSEVESQSKPKKGFEKRIGKEIARKNEALREAEYWKRVALERGAGETKVEPQQQVQAPVKPKFSDYNDIEAYAEAVAVYTVEEKFRKQEQRAQQVTQEQTYKSRLEEFKKSTPDFDDVLASTDATVSDAVKASIFESDVGPAVLYYLANNEDEAKRINGMSAVRQIAEIGKIEARLSTQKPQEKKVSKAPAPLKPLSGGAPVTSKKLDDPTLSAEEWIKMRNKAKRFK